jgi:hypothetical protein
LFQRLFQRFRCNKRHKPFVLENLLSFSWLLENCLVLLCLVSCWDFTIPKFMAAKAAQGFQQFAIYFGMAWENSTI